MLARELELWWLRSEYEDYNTVNLHPTQIDIPVPLASSVLLPVTFLAVEMHLSTSLPIL